MLEHEKLKTSLTNYRDIRYVYQRILHYVPILLNIASINWSIAETSILLLIGGWGLFSRSFYTIYILS